MQYTVVIPAYNATATIAETIQSVFTQTVAPHRVIVVDDGSTDDTRAVVGPMVESSGGLVKLLCQSNQGPGAAMSLGMRHCETPLIAAIDADDLWLPEKIERQLDFLQCHPNCSGVFTRMQQFGEAVAVEAIQDGWGRSTMLIRREVFGCVGDVVDPPGKRGEMIDWLARAREAGFELALMPDVLARRRVSPNSLSAGRDATKDRSYVLVAIAALQRKRAKLAGVAGP